LIEISAAYLAGHNLPKTEEHYTKDDAVKTLQTAIKLDSKWHKIAMREAGFSTLR
jgi:hypothetical protein